MISVHYGVQIGAPDFFFILPSEGLGTLKGKRASKSYSDYQLKNCFSFSFQGPYLEGFEEDFEPPQMVIQSPSPNKSPPNKSDNNNLKPDDIVKDKDVKKQGNLLKGISSKTVRRYFQFMYVLFSVTQVYKETKWV